MLPVGPLDSCVDVLPGGLFLGGLGASGRGSGEDLRSGLGGITILGSAGSPTLAEEGGQASLLFGDVPTGAGATMRSGALLSPLTFQGETSRESSVLRIRRPVSLDGLSGEPAHGPASKAKMFSLFKFDLDGKSGGFSKLMRGVFSPQDLCGGVIAKSGRFCTKEECEVQSHRTKAWQDGRMLPAFYLLDDRQQRA